MSRATKVLAVGDTFGNYVLLEALGFGAMAEVFRAEVRGRTVALKVLYPANQFDLEFDAIRSFIEEARLATRFDHVNIAKTHNLGKHGGRYFIEMEYVAGRTLQRVLRTSERAAIPIDVTIELLIQLCDALSHVHELRDDVGQSLELIHRDVSPSNIIVSCDGTVKLIDFGIAKGHSARMPTQAGIVKGKLGYVAPEYVKGKKIDQRADLFAVGVIAHELLTGERLFHGKNDLDTLHLVVNGPIAPPSCSRPGVSASLDAIVARALERDPDHRWPSAADLRSALISLRSRDADQSIARTWLETSFAPHKLREPSSQLAKIVDALESPVASLERSPATVSEHALVARRPNDSNGQSGWFATVVELAVGIAFGIGVVLLGVAVLTV